MVNQLRNLLHVALMFGDGLKDAGLQAEPQVVLSREDGLRLLKLVTQCNSPIIELHAHDRFTVEDDKHCVKLGQVKFCWSAAQALEGEAHEVEVESQTNAIAQLKLLN